MDAHRHIASLLGLTLLASACAVAAATVPDERERPNYVLRLSADGATLAAVPLNGGSDTYLLLAPLDPPLDASGLGVAAGVSGVLALPGGQSARLALSSSQQTSLAAGTSTVAPWCGHLAAWMAVSGAGECLVSSQPATALPQFVRNRAELGFGGEHFDVALAYGITNASGNAAALGVVGSVDAWAPLSFSGAPGGAGTLGLQSFGQDLTLTGTWHPSPGSAMSVSAALGQSSISGATLLPLDYEHAALGLGVRRGPFSGSVVGRVMRPSSASVGLVNGSDAAFAGIDIGVSWRTPWQGELTFGARNLVTSGSEPLLTPPANSELDASATRTPYVQYKQDL